MSPPIATTPLLDVAVHLQDNKDLCGRACAEMVLLFLTHKLFQQTALIPPAPDPPWKTSPNQLRDLINERLPPGRFKRYRVHSEATRVDALDRVWRALNEGYPAVTLSDQDHWIVVHGITEGRPAIAHFRNPMPDRMHAIKPPLPDHSTEDECAEKDLLNSEEPNGEVASVWSQYCLDAAADLPTGNPLKGRYIVVAPDILRIGEAHQFRISEGILDGTIGERAWKRLQETGVLEQPGWNAFADAPPLVGDAQSVNVESVTGNGNEFVLVRLTNANGGVVLVNLMTTGEFGAAMLEPSIQLMETQFATVPVLIDNLRIEPGATVRPIWRHTRELFFSPFVFALEVRPPGAPTYFVRPYDGTRFQGWE